MRVDHEARIIFVRQSWLGDMAICPERARYGQTRPDLRTGSDATNIGTAIHAGIEQVLNSVVNSRDEFHAVVAGEYERLDALPHKTTNIIPESIPESLKSMGEAFYESILPYVTLGGTAEQKFAVPLYTRTDGYQVWVEGTMDYVDPNFMVWDWKTAGKPYYEKEKQKSAIQPTVYCYATSYIMPDAAAAGNFRYGVMIRQPKPKAQIVNITRGQDDYVWLLKQVSSAVNMAETMGHKAHWLMNDTTPLCSEQWCSFWSICKGAK